MLTSPVIEVVPLPFILILSDIAVAPDVEVPVPIEIPPLLFPLNWI